MERKQIKFRMPADMKRKLEQAASDKGVSFSAEVIQRISQTMKDDRGGDEYWRQRAA